MKKIKNYFVSLFVLMAMPLSSVLAQDAFNSVNPGSAVTFAKDVNIDGDIYYNVAPNLNLTVPFPAAWKSQIVRVDYENESIYSLKTGNKTPAFLFSVTKVTSDQWMQLKDQVKRYTIIENKDGFITYVEKTDVKKFKESADAQYHVMVGALDAIVASIQVK